MRFFLTMPYDKITARDKILSLLVDHERITSRLISLWLSGLISDEAMLKFVKKLSTSYPQFDLTDKIPVVKYN